MRDRQTMKRIPYFGYIELFPAFFGEGEEGSEKPSQGSLESPMFAMPGNRLAPRIVVRPPLDGGGV